MDALELQDAGLWATQYRADWELDQAVANNLVIRVAPFFLSTSVVSHDFDRIVRQLDRILPNPVIRPRDTPGYCILCNTSDFQINPEDLRQFVRNVANLRPSLRVTLISASHRINALAAAHIRDFLPLQFQRVSDLYVVRIA